MDSLSLHEMLNNIESKLNSKSQPRIFETKITSDLKYFKETAKKNYEDKLISDTFLPGGYNELDKKVERKTYISSSYQNNNFLNSSPNSDIEIRKVIEREMEPYIFSAKNELKLVIDNFVKDLSSYKYVQTDMNLVKESVQENKKLILIFQEDIEKRFSEYTHKFYNINKQFEDVKLNFSDFTKRVKNFEKMYENLEDRTNQVESITEKINSFESNSEKLYKSIEENISYNFSSKLKNFESGFEILKSSQNNMSDLISEININYLNLEGQIKQINSEKFKLEENTLINKEKLNSMNHTINTLNTKYENISNSFNNINDKFSSCNKILEDNNEKSLYNEKNLSDLNEKFAALENSNLETHDKVNTLSLNFSSYKNEFSTLNSTSKNNNEKLQKLNERINEVQDNLSSIINEKIREGEDNTQILSQKLNEKINKFNDQMIVINASVNELTLNFSQQKANLNTISQSLSGNSPVEQLKVNEIFEKSLNQLVKQFMTLSQDVETLKSENSRFEDNFEAIQENFEKINIPSIPNDISNSSPPEHHEKIKGIETQISNIEKNQNLINEIIKTMSVNQEGFKSNILTEIESLKKNDQNLQKDLMNISNNVKEIESQRQRDKEIFHSQQIHTQVTEVTEKFDNENANSCSPVISESEKKDIFEKLEKLEKLEETQKSTEKRNNTLQSLITEISSKLEKKENDNNIFAPVISETEKKEIFENFKKIEEFQKSTEKINNTLQGNITEISIKLEKINSGKLENDKINSSTEIWETNKKEIFEKLENLEDFQRSSQQRNSIMDNIITEISSKLGKLNSLQIETTSQINNSQSNLQHLQEDLKILKEEFDKKISNTNSIIQSKFIENHENTQNTQNIQNLQNSIIQLDSKLNIVEKDLQSSLNTKFQEIDEKITKVVNYFDPKYDELVECINIICAKYDLNLANLNIPNNNLTNSNILNNLQHSNIEKDENTAHNSSMHLIQMWPSGYVNNQTCGNKFSLKKDANHSIQNKTQFNIAEDKFFQKNNLMNLTNDHWNSQDQDDLTSHKNNIEDKKTKVSSPQKFEKNQIYLETNPMNFNEIKPEMKGYLNKYLMFQKQYENVIEVDLELQQHENAESHDLHEKSISKKPHQESYLLNKANLQENEDNWDVEDFSIEEIVDIDKEDILIDIPKANK